MNTRNIPCPTDASIILTYRCPMKCKMCNIWFNLSLIHISEPTD
mgnify:CR=1 FL=1